MLPLPINPPTEGVAPCHILDLQMTPCMCHILDLECDTPDDILYVSHSRSWLMFSCEKGGVMVVGQVINKTSSSFHTSRIFSLKLNNFVAWLKSRAGHLLESFRVKRYQKPPKFSSFFAACHKLLFLKGGHF